MFSTEDYDNLNVVKYDPAFRMNAYQALEPGASVLELNPNFNKNVKDGLDSNDERYFVWWLQAMIKLGHVESAFLCESMTLFPSIKYGAPELRKDRRGFKKLKYKTVTGHSAGYTPDFIIHWNPQFIADNYQNDFFLEYEFVFDKASVTHKLLVERPPTKNTFFYYENLDGDLISVIDIKPAVKGFNNHHRDFPLKQKVMFFDYDLFVQDFALIDKHRIPVLFKELGTPERYLLTDKSMRARKLNYNPKKII